MDIICTISELIYTAAKGSLSFESEGISAGFSVLAEISTSRFPSPLFTAVRSINIEVIYKG